MIAAVLFGSAGASAAVRAPQLASACSCSNCDTLVDAPIIVGGWIEGWEKAGVPHPAPGAHFVPITFKFTTDQVFKGQVPPEFAGFDFSSYSESPAGWFGGSGACGKFDEDPTGRYMIAGLAPSTDYPGSYTGGRLWLFYIGDAPEGEAYDRALERLSPLGPPSPPAAGNSISSPEPEMPILAVSLLAISATLAALALARRR